MTDTISVIVTTFKRYEKLKELIESIHKQTYENIEIIVADDCSNDETYKIQKDYPEVKYFSNQENIGYAKNCKKAIKYTTGDYVIFLSDDDLLLDTEFFTRSMSLFHKDKNIDSVFGRVEIYSDGHYITSSYPFKEIYSSKGFIDEIIKLRFSFLDYFSFSSFIFKKGIFLKTNPFEATFPYAGSVDITAIIKYLLISKKVAFSDTTAYRWIKSVDNSLSGYKKNDLTYQVMQSVSAAFDIQDFNNDQTYICNAYLEYIFDAILSDYESLNNKANFENILKGIKKSNPTYIYCRGWVGLSLKDYLESQGITITNFIDDYKTDLDDTKNFDWLSKISSPINVIIANYKYKDIYLIFRKLEKKQNINILSLI